MNVNTEITDKLFIVARLLEKTADQLFSRFDITTRMYEILMLINEGTTTTTDLARIMQTSLGNIAHKTKVLEENEYLKRLINRKDKRIWTFEITEKGKKCLETIRLTYREATKFLYSEFSKEQRDQILDFLKTTETHLKFVLQNKDEIKHFLDDFLEKSGQSNNSSF